SCLAISVGGQYLGWATDDYRLGLWNIATGEPKREPIGGDKGVSAVEFSHDGVIVASSWDDDKIRLWDMT
ncbi:hypothetical protein SISSUDRAFT_963313, partial [Sistotremastrum suecicum HHB10207 ss-3]